MLEFLSPALQIVIVRNPQVGGFEVEGGRLGYRVERVILEESP